MLRDKTGRVQAFANDLPSFKPGVATLDLMRHNHDSPPNSIDFLFIKIILLKNNEGYEGFNLGMSPLDGRQFVDNLSEKTILYFYKISNNFIGFSGLHQFKAKFQPDWEPRYVWYKGSKMSLIKIGFTVYKLLSGK